MRFGTLALLLVLLVLPAWAQPAMPALTGRVVDHAEVLSTGAEDALTALLAAHEDSTSNQIAILTVPTLAGVPVESYALHVAETWQLGTAAFDNGLLILIAPGDRAARIEVGEGLEGALPDVVASRILRHEMVPHFRAGDYESGIEAGAVAVVGALEGTYTPPPIREPSSLGEVRAPGWLAMVGFFFSGLLVIASALWGMTLTRLPRRVAAFFGLLVLYALAAWMIGFGVGDLSISVAVMIALLMLHTLFFLMSSFSSGASGSGSTGIRTASGSYSGGYASGGSSSSSYSGSSFSGGGGSFSGGGASASW